MVRQQEMDNGDLKYWMEICREKLNITHFLQ
jgi:hypothetical protein